MITCYDSINDSDSDSDSKQLKEPLEIGLRAVPVVLTLTLIIPRRIQFQIGRNRMRLCLVDLLLVAVFFVCGVVAYPHVAPKLACWSMRPSHSGAPQRSAAPFRIVAPATYQPGQEIEGKWLRLLFHTRSPQTLRKSDWAIL